MRRWKYAITLHIVSIRRVVTDIYGYSANMTMFLAHTAVIEHPEKQL